MTNSNEREFIEVKDMNKMWELKEIVGIKDNSCYYCKKELKKGDKCSVFNKPDRLVCDSLLCLSEAVGECQYSNSIYWSETEKEYQKKGNPFGSMTVHDRFAFQQFLADKAQHEKEMKELNEIYKDNKALKQNQCNIFECDWAKAFIKKVGEISALKQKIKTIITMSGSESDMCVNYEEIRKILQEKN